MKHQQVSVDYWAMGKAMLVYGGLTLLCWVMIRLFNAVVSLPRRMRAQQQSIQDTLQELQRRFPDMNITEEDLKEAEKELDEYMKEDTKQLDVNGDKSEEKQKKSEENAEKKLEETPQIEDKKTI